MFSRLERDVFEFFCFLNEFLLRAFGVLTSLVPVWICGFLMSCDHGYTLRLRGEQSPRFVRWRFDKSVFGYHVWNSISTAASLHTLQGKNVKPVVCCWASGLGIGFWLRGVQPRTTVR